MPKPSAPRVFFPARWIVAVAVVAGAAVLLAAGPAKSIVNGDAVDRGKAVVAATASSKPSAPSATTRARVNASYAALPLAFEANEGQTDPQVKYMARGKGYTLFLTSNEVNFVMPVAAKQNPKSPQEMGPRDMLRHKMIGPAKTMKELHKGVLQQDRRKNLVADVAMHMLGSNPLPQIASEGLLTGKTNYILGRDSKKWHSNVAQYAQVRYHDIYPNVDLSFHGQGKLEFDFVVNPGAKADAIRLGFQGVKEIRTSNTGDLVLTSEAGDLHLHQPVAYQEKNGVRLPVDARFEIRNHEVAFALGAYDHSTQLVIDPTVSYSTYLGGSQEDDANAITVDSSGNAYITGETDSTDFPSAGGLTKVGPVTGFDVFVSEISSSGALVFTTLIGGDQEDIGNAIAVDSQGIYVAGGTSSDNFPTTTGQRTFEGGTTSGPNDGFVFKLALNGSALSWSTYIAGTDSDTALGVAVDSNHDVYVVGDTFSTDLGGGTVNSLSGGSSINNGTGAGADDGFIAKVKNDGSQYLFLSYLGGSNGDLATGVAVNSSGNVYVSGETISADFPVTNGAFQTQCGTDGNCNSNSSNIFDDGFVTAITSSNAPGYLYSTYIGGEDTDDAFGIVADSSGNAYLTGQTFSTEFPTQNPVTGLDTLVGTQNAFITSLNAAGTDLNYSTYLGGSGSDAGFNVGLDSSKNAYITGFTSSSDFPVQGAPQTTFGGGSSSAFDSDAFVSEVSLNGTSLSIPFSTYLGGSGDEDFILGGIAVNPSSGKILVTGVTNSSNFNTTSNAADGTYNSSGGNCELASSQTVPCPDAFLVVYTQSADFSVAGSPLAAVSPGSSSTSTITVSPFNGYNSTVNLSCSVSGGGTSAPTCSLSSSSVSGGSGTATLTVNTTGSTAMLNPGKKHSGIFYALLLPIGGMALLAAGLSTTGTRRKRLFGFLFFGMMLTALLVMPACGGSSGGSGGGGGGGGGTSAGTYTVTVTGTDGTLTHSIVPALTLKVN